MTQKHQAPELELVPSMSNWFVKFSSLKRKCSGRLSAQAFVTAVRLILLQIKEGLPEGTVGNRRPRSQSQDLDKVIHDI